MLEKQHKFTIHFVALKFQDLFHYQNIYLINNNRFYLYSFVYTFSLSRFL